LAANIGQTGDTGVDKHHINWPVRRLAVSDSCSDLIALSYVYCLYNRVWQVHLKHALGTPRHHQHRVSGF
jgi:hypothetical protein